MVKKRIVSATAILAAVGAAVGGAVGGAAGGGAHATTYYVNGNCGHDGWSGTSPVCVGPNGPKATFQAAIDATSAGDEVVVADGVYSGIGNRNIRYRGKPITVRSANGPQQCVIDCGGSDRAFTLADGETLDSVIQGSERDCAPYCVAGYQRDPRRGFGVRDSGKRETPPLNPEPRTPIPQSSDEAQTLALSFDAAKLLVSFLSPWPSGVLSVVGP